MSQTNASISISEDMLASIVEAPIPTFEKLTAAKRSHLLRLAADALNQTAPASSEGLRLAHQLATWANQLDGSQSKQATCECGNCMSECICDQRAAEHYLESGDASLLIGLGWPRDVLVPLQDREVTPAELLTQTWRNAYQKRATPAELRWQSC